MANDEKYSQVVCPGDSGGGLLISQTKNDDERYYLQGVVSTSPKTMDCVTDFYTLFNNVHDYKDFINSVVNKVSGSEWQVIIHLVSIYFYCVF